MKRHTMRPAQLARTMLLSVVLIAIDAGGASAEAWREIASGKRMGISGIALASTSPQSDRYIIVHDNKRSGEARLGLLTTRRERVRYDTVQWRGKDAEPRDLEAMAPLGPRSKRNYLVMTSSGSVYHLGFSTSFRKAKVMASFDVPAGEPGANYEGLAIWSRGKRFLVAWGHRGRSSSPGILYWGWLDLEAASITVEGQAEIEVPWPDSSVRHISDLSIEDGELFLSAASDPGDNGPFSGALYSAGTFSVDGESIQFEKALEEIHRSDAYKIEAITPVKGGFALGSDDENKGSAFAVIKP